MKNMSIVGVDIGGTSIEAGLVLGGKILTKKTNSTGASRSKEEILETLYNCIDSVITPEVVAIGIGVPGLLDYEKGQLLDIINIPAWKNLALKEIVQEKYKITVYLNNDANCFALGEKYYGKGKNVDNMLAIALGTGVGGGIILNNKLVTGLFGGAGEIGALSYKDRNFEFYCGSNFFKEKYNSTGKELYQLATENNEESIEAFKALGEHIGEMIHQILFMLAPNMIVLGGSISKSYPLFQATLQKQIDQFPFESVRKGVKIEQSELKDIAIFGAAAQYFNALV
ncbi:ROK family protein [Ancylomarina sp. DW003]|nr:ROK family protein [Ancylomarina sp. DW003]MDE5424224.1 ROK family protein [Ancylomarina sp. DW003]